MDGITRVVVYTALALAVAGIGVSVAFFAVNAGDEELSAEAAQMSKLPPNPYAAEHNLYIALAGLDAPQGQSAIAAGQKRIAAYDRIATMRGRDRKAAMKAEDERSDRLESSSDYDCRPVSRSCWASVETRRAEHRSLLAADAELYRRYLGLHATRGYFEIAKPSPSTPVVYAPQPLRSLFLEDVAVRVQDARTSQARSAALADLDRDIRTWRGMLTGEGGIVSRFVALYNLHGDYALLADIVGDSRVPLSAHLSEIEGMLSRVAPDDWKIAGALDDEYRSLAVLLDDIVREGNLLGEPRDPGEKAPWWQSLMPWDTSSLFQINATKNLAARHTLEMRRVAAADGRNFAAEHESLKRWREEYLVPDIGYFRNPFGKFLLSVGAPEFDQYVLRAHDIAGFHRLVKLGFEVRKHNVGDEAIPAFIRKHPWASHPVSGDAFTWDAARRELVMVPLAAVNKERRFRVPVK